MSGEIVTSTTDRTSWVLVISVLVLLGTSIGITLGLLSPVAAGLLFGGGAAAVLIAAGRRYRRR